MRLMMIMNWNVISIINLSDLTSGNIKDFREKLIEAEHYGYKNHSIFVDARFVERNLFLYDSYTKIILAWGKDPCIKELAREAYKKTPKKQSIFGLSYVNPSWGFRHPNPMIQSKCMEWLQQMEQQLTNDDYQQHSLDYMRVIT